MPGRWQHPTGPCVADFHWREARLVIEVGGPVHATTEARDNRGDAWMTSQGIAVVRFKNDQVLTETHATLDELAMLTL